ncbi:MAG: Crp/Fnr family transcriptional regulator, partial [Thermosynechococcaceae cyanobacterium]
GLPLTQVEPYYISCLGDVKARLLASRHHWSIETLLGHIQQAEALLQIVRGKRICDRLQPFLVWLAQRFGYPTDQGWVTELQLTHQEIAETLGTSRVTITRLLKTLEQDGFMRRSRKRYLLLPQTIATLPMPYKSGNPPPCGAFRKEYAVTSHYGELQALFLS